jgi:hypothetical protein
MRTRAKKSTPVGPIPPSHARDEIRIKSITIKPRPRTPEQDAALARLARSLLGKTSSSKPSGRSS